MSKKVIEIDCPPGHIRPGDLIASIIKGTPLENLEELKPENTTHRLFGEWAWEFEIDDKIYADEVLPVITPRIDRLYYCGIIRYASW